MLAIIGGSGLTQLSSLEVSRHKDMRTPYCEPSWAMTFGRIGACDGTGGQQERRGEQGDRRLDQQKVAHPQESHQETDHRRDGTGGSDPHVHDRRS